MFIIYQSFFLNLVKQAPVSARVASTSRLAFEGFAAINEHTSGSALFAHDGIIGVVLSVSIALIIECSLLFYYFNSYRINRLLSFAYIREVYASWPLHKYIWRAEIVIFYKKIYPQLLLLSQIFLIVILVAAFVHLLYKSF